MCIPWRIHTDVRLVHQLIKNKAKVGILIKICVVLDFDGWTCLYIYMDTYIVLDFFEQHK